MGKTKLAVIDESVPEKKTESGKSRKAERARKEKGIRVPGLKGGERVVSVGGEPTTEPTTQKEEAASAKTSEGNQKERATRKRGKAYLAARAKVEPGKAYSLEEAARLVRETSISKFDGSVELHLTLGKDQISTSVDLPHSSGKKRKVEFANEDTIKKLKLKKIDFDELVSTPEFMPQLVPFAKLLGPKGLMPNPKDGTIVKDEKEAKTKFSASALQLKTQNKAPLLHATIGKVEQAETELVDNMEAVFKAVGPNIIKKAIISASMGPGIRVTVT